MKLPPLKYVSVENYILKMVKGRSVLHLGCVGDFLPDGPSGCLHKRISTTATQIWGIDLNREGLDKLRCWVPENGERIRYFLGDVEHLLDLNIKQKFQVVLVGSIIEHLSNPGNMLCGCKELLEPNGNLIIVTPHSFGLLQCLRVFFRRYEAVHPQHTCWFSVSVLRELCSRYGLFPAKWYTGYVYRSPSLRVKTKRLIGVPFFRLFPHLGGSLIGVFKIGE